MEPHYMQAFLTANPLPQNDLIPCCFVPSTANLSRTHAGLFIIVPYMNNFHCQLCAFGFVFCKPHLSESSLTKLFAKFVALIEVHLDNVCF